jgi:hypothetical protein
MIGPTSQDAPPKQQGTIDYGALAKQAGAINDWEPIPAGAKQVPLPQGATIEKSVPETITPETQPKQGPPINPATGERWVDVRPISPSVTITPDPIATVRRTDQSDQIKDPAACLVFDLSTAGDFKTLYVDKGGAISSVELTTGESLHREPYSSFLTHLLPLLLYPVLGFLAPWVAIRVVVWVGAGFFKP